MSTIASFMQPYQQIDTDISSQLDEIRGFSAFMVCFAHTYLIFIYPIFPSVMLPIYLIGHAGVMGFFIMSGLLIAKSASLNITKNGYFNTKQYAVSRLNRIIPPFYFGCLFLLLLYILSPLVFATGTRDFISVGSVMTQAKMSLDSSFIGTVFFVNGFLTATPASNFAFWSLSFEFWFYTLFACILYRNKYISISFSAILFVTLTLLNFTFFCYSLPWIAGVIISVLHNKQAIYHKKVIAYFISLALLSVFFGIYYLNITTYPNKNDVLLTTYGTSIDFCLCIVFYLILYKKLTIYLPFKSLANISYTLYILHFPLLLFIYGIIQPYIYSNKVLLFIAALLSMLFCILISKKIGMYLEKVRIIN